MTSPLPTSRRPGVVAVHSVDRFVFTVPDLAEAQRFYTAFGLDVRRPGQLTAVVARPPVFGARLKSLDDRAARAVPGVKAVLRVRCSSLPRAVSVPVAGCMNEVFISMVTMPMVLSTLRAAVARATSSKVINEPPWATLKELRCSGSGVKRNSDSPSSKNTISKPRCSTNGM